jgi:hypothetical protein
MRRREFISAAALLPLAARAQPSSKLYRLGYLSAARIPNVGRNMTGGIDPTQDALARWIAANANTVATEPGAGPGMFRGALNWLTGAPSVPEVVIALLAAALMG